MLDAEAAILPAAPGPPPEDPLADRAARWSKHVEERLAGWTPFCDAVQQIWHLPIVRAGRWTVAGGGGIASTAIIAVTAGPAAAGATSAGGIIIARLAMWAYALLRRRNPTLPGLPQPPATPGSGTASTPTAEVSR